MNKQDYIEKKQLENTLSQISQTVDAIIVEGWSDKKIIQKLGFQGKIYMSAEKTLEDLVEDVARGSTKAAVLTDFDQHGKKQAKQISHELDKEIDVIHTARNKFGTQLTERKNRRAIEDARPLFQDPDQKFIDASLDQLYFNP